MFRRLLPAMLAGAFLLGPATLPVVAGEAASAPLRLAQATLPGKVVYRMKKVSGALDGFEADAKTDYAKDRKLPLMKSALGNADPGPHSDLPACHRQLSGKW